MIIVLFAAISLILGGLAAYFFPYIWRYIRVQILKNRLANSGTLILTYDDGPSETLTPRVLDILQLHKARACFFMLGSKAKRCSTIADRIVCEGHEVGCHSDQHLNAWKVLPSTAIADINAGYASLSRWVASDGMFRPPYGKITLPTYLTLRRRRATLAWWTVVSGDTTTPLPTPGAVVEAVRLAKGGVVLMHDFDGSKGHSDFVCETTELLLRMAGQHSIKVRVLSDLARNT